MSRPRFFAPMADGSGAVALPADEAHHLRHVLRLTAGADVSVFDGRGREWAGRVAATSGKRDAIVELLHEATPAIEPRVRVTLAIGVLKGDQMDAAIRDATMMGAAEIAPISSAHVVVPPRAWQGQTAVPRWTRVAIASAKQCGRAVVPTVSPVVSFTELMASATADLTLMCVEPACRAEAPTPLASIAARPTVLAAVGPEGGWSPAEVDLARAKGANLVQLGPRTLRAESAPTVLLSAMWAVWGW